MPTKQIVCYECGQTGHIRTKCPKFKTTKSASAKRVVVVNEQHVPATAAAGEAQSDTTTAAAAAATLGLGAEVAVGGIGCSEPAVEPAQPVNTVTAAADEFMNERTCDIEAISVSCPLAQLSALTYVDVAVKCSENCESIGRHGCSNICN